MYQCSSCLFFNGRVFSIFFRLMFRGSLCYTISWKGLWQGRAICDYLGTGTSVARITCSLSLQSVSKSWPSLLLHPTWLWFEVCRFLDNMSSMPCLTLCKSLRLALNIWTGSFSAGQHICGNVASLIMHSERLSTLVGLVAIHLATPISCAVVSAFSAWSSLSCATARWVMDACSVHTSNMFQ